MDDNLESIVDKIAKSYSVGDKTHEPDEKDVVFPKVRCSEAMKAL